MDEMQTVEDVEEVKQLLTTGSLEEGNVHIKHEGYIVKSDNDDGAFVRLTLKREDGVESPPNELEGWKFHIGLDETDDVGFTTAWDIIVDVVLKYKLGEAKFLRSDSHLTPRQAGKEITLYIDEKDNPELNWSEIITEINNRLDEAGVKPGVRAFGDKPISGSSYITYRYDEPEGEYVRAVDTGFKAIPDHMLYADPFQGMQVTEISEVEGLSRLEVINRSLKEYSVGRQEVKDLTKIILELDKQISTVQNEINNLEVEFDKRAKDANPRGKWGNLYATSLLEERKEKIEDLNMLSKQLSKCINTLEQIIELRTEVGNAIVEVNEAKQAGLIDETTAQGYRDDILECNKEVNNSIIEIVRCEWEIPDISENYAEEDWAEDTVVDMVRSHKSNSEALPTLLSQLKTKLESVGSELRSLEENKDTILSEEKRNQFNFGGSTS